MVAGGGTSYTDGNVPKKLGSYNLKDMAKEYLAKW